MTNLQQDSFSQAANHDPVRIFLSYASEDEDIMVAVSEALDGLDKHSRGDIRVIYDRKSLEAGSPIPLIRDISDKLLGSDYLIILYTGALKKSFSWTGTELGIFWGFIRSEERDGKASQRKIIAIYFDERPPVDWGALEINLGISPLDLRLPADQFKQRVIGSIQQYAALLNTLTAVGAAADSRLPPQLGQSSFASGEWQNYIAKRTNAISDEIVPELMVHLHDSFAKRVKKTNVEQNLIEFQIPKTWIFSDEALLPDDAVLVDNEEAFSLFKVGSGGKMTWAEFKQALADVTTEAPSITASIERTVISAIASEMDRDDEQIIRVPKDQAIYRLIVTRRFEFYDGSKLAHVYFIPALRFVSIDTSRTAVTLGFVNVAVKYREVFINPESELSILDYYRPMEFDALKARVRRSIRELLIIEDESHILKLDQRSSIAIYYGPSEQDAIDVGKLQGDWKRVRQALVEAAQAVLRIPSTASDANKAAAQNSWVEALKEFVRVSDQINSEVLAKAIKNLDVYLFDDKPGANTAVDRRAAS